MSKLPAGNPSTTEQRSRLLCGSVLWQTWHPQPIAGTPTEVPVPSKIISPRKSIVWGILATENLTRKLDDQECCPSPRWSMGTTDDWRLTGRPSYRRMIFTCQPRDPSRS